MSVLLHCILLGVLAIPVLSNSPTCLAPSTPEEPIPLDYDCSHIISSLLPHIPGPSDAHDGYTINLPKDSEAYRWKTPARITYGNCDIEITVSDPNTGLQLATPTLLTKKAKILMEAQVMLIAIFHRCRYDHLGGHWTRVLNVRGYRQAQFYVAMRKRPLNNYYLFES
jgi:hypothetical protein